MSTTVEVLERAIQDCQKAESGWRRDVSRRLDRIDAPDGTVADLERRATDLERFVERTKGAVLILAPLLAFGGAVLGAWLGRALGG